MRKRAEKGTKEGQQEGTKAPKKEKRPGRGFRFLGWGALLPMLADAGIGILFLALPYNSLSALSIAVGVLFCALGVMLLLSAFLRASAGIMRLALGACFVGFAVWLFVRPGDAVKILLYVLLAMLLLHSLSGMWSALAQMKKGGKWWQLQLTGCLILAIGTVVVCFLSFGTVSCLVTGVLYAVAAALGLSSRLARLFSPRAEQKASREEAPKAQEEAPEKRPEEAPAKRRLFKGRKSGTEE